MIIEHNINLILCLLGEITSCIYEDTEFANILFGCFLAKTGGL